MQLEEYIGLLELLLGLNGKLGQPLLRDDGILELTNKSKWKFQLKLFNGTNKK